MCFTNFRCLERTRNDDVDNVDDNDDDDDDDNDDDDDDDDDEDDDDDDICLSYDVDDDIDVDDMILTIWWCSRWRRRCRRR